MKCLMLAVAIFANGFDYCGATPPDRIYVIKEGSTTSYQCNIDEFYVSSKLNNALFASSCVETLSTGTVPTVSTGSLMTVYMAGSNDVLINQECRFVDHLGIGPYFDPNVPPFTRTVIDCRGL